MSKDFVYVIAYVTFYCIELILSNRLSNRSTWHITTLGLGRENMAERGVSRKLLWKYKAIIVNELDVSRVLPVLVRRGVFNDLEEREILLSSDARFRADLFVDRLSAKGPAAFYQFCKALELTHPNLLTRFLLQSASPDQLGKCHCYAEASIALGHTTQASPHIASNVNPLPLNVDSNSSHDKLS